jgi:hypothetical protein
VRLSSLAGLAVIVACGCVAPAVKPRAVGPLVVREQADSGGALFLGSAACRSCHAVAYARWLATGHAREFAGLSPAERAVSACLRCHVTGYGDRLGYRAGGDAPDLANVGCEACHGPGADHGHSSHPELVPTRTGGACPPCEVNRICRLCHTPERSPGFDLELALSRTSCTP